jgi:hypothetical protein
MKLVVPTICAAAFMASSALGQTLQIRGVTGYLSEYELTADVSRQSAEGGPAELSGLLTVTHVGLCTHSGPNEVLGQLKLRFVGASRKIEAILSYDGQECTYYGYFSESDTGFMTCSDKVTLPVKLWTK